MVDPRHMTEEELLHYAALRDDPWVVALVRRYEVLAEEVAELRRALAEQGL